MAIIFLDNGQVRSYEWQERDEYRADLLNHYQNPAHDIADLAYRGYCNYLVPQWEKDIIAAVATELAGGRGSVGADAFWQKMQEEWAESRDEIVSPYGPLGHG